ncbi:MAG: DNA polymerase Y family protein, partial [Gammaproteobacteria bacterium]|nr:DNA polymerase Y family protein [Gammaproteobacteria bacterium]
PPPLAAAPPPRSPLAPARPRPRALWYAVLFPELQTAPSRQCSLERLAQHAGRFTSRVSLEPPAALLLEIRASLRLFGPLETLCARLEARWRELAVPARAAVAPSPRAALWFARAGEAARIEDPAALAGRLARLPLACTAWDGERLERLRAFGVRRLGELLRLPRAGLARRFGPAILDEIDEALARRAAPRRSFVPRERFVERCDFETEIESSTRLAHHLAPTIGRCARFLRERGAGVLRLDLDLRHRGAPVTHLALGFAGVTGDERRLAAVLEERLSRLTLSAPVRAARLRSAALEPLSGESLGAFAGSSAARTGTGAAPLIERLRARFGETAVYGVAAVAEHRPEAASRRVHPWNPAAAPGSATGEESVPRPVWLLAAPLRLAAPLGPERSEPPADAWRIEQGPERIESGWWDGAGIARDYYVARDAQGARLWVFQERRSGHWYLHGVFA